MSTVGRMSWWSPERAAVVLRLSCMTLVLAAWRGPSPAATALAVIALGAMALPIDGWLRRQARRASLIRSGAPATDYERGYAVLAAGRAADAVPLLRRALAERPGDADARFHLGVALTALGRHEEAADELRRVIDARPLDAAAHRQLGVTLSRAGHPMAGISALRDAVRLSPTDREATGALAEAERRVGIGRAGRKGVRGRGTRRAETRRSA